jgi:DNA replication protein DnaC
MAESLPFLLKSLNLSSFHDHFQSLAENSEREGVTHTGYLYELAQMEYEQRSQRRIQRLIKEARLPRDKLLSDFESYRIAGLAPSLLERLAKGDFMDRCENLLIFGNPGTGKTHLSIGLAREWCLQGRKVLYTPTARLVQELLKAKQNLLLNEQIKKLDHFEILILDDISYVPYDRTETDVLFTLLSERYEQRSVVVTSNLAFSEWNKIFKDEMTTAAAIDRLVHHASILELNAESYRCLTAKKRVQKSEGQINRI